MWYGLWCGIPEKPHAAYIWIMWSLFCCIRGWTHVRVGGHARVITVSGIVAEHVAPHNSPFLNVMIQLLNRINCDGYIRGNHLWFPLTCSKFQKIPGEREKSLRLLR
ncbi:hypothetical protein Hanom_Chr01g00051201 [Helianthus anomalus]